MSDMSATDMPRSIPKRTAAGDAIIRISMVVVSLAMGLTLYVYMKCS